MFDERADGLCAANEALREVQEASRSANEPFRGCRKHRVVSGCDVWNRLSSAG